MQAFARMTLPVRRVWSGVTARIGVRKRGKSQFPTNHLMLKMVPGHMKLRKDVRSCEYEDVRVMWEMLSRTQAETNQIRSPAKRKRTLSSCLDWAGQASFLCRTV